MPRAKKVGGPVPVEATVHREATRTNIPTSELEGFLRPEDRAPKKMLYPRDPTLDPQLVWKGKDDQDREPLEVPAVPIYIQEKIAPKALIEDLRTRSDTSEQPSLFADFNGIEFDDLVDFYRHRQNWSNRMILGDSLLVMTSLAEKEALKDQVQCIYVDPPYGIKFGSNWQVSTRKRDVKDGRVDDATRQPEQIKAFRDTWELGIHSYLTYLRDRLTVARDLLTPSGSIFVQMNAENQHLVRAVLDEVFGANNFCSLITYQKTSGMSSPLARVNVLASVADFLIWYAKDRDSVKYRQLYTPKAIGAEGSGVYSWLDLGAGNSRRMTAEEGVGRAPLPAGARVFQVGDVTSMGYASAGDFPVEFQSGTYFPGPTRHWTTTAEGMRRLAAAGRLVVSGKSLRYKRYYDDFPVSPLGNVWTDAGTGSFTDDKIYVVQTNTKVVERCVLMTTDPGDLVLDPTAGGGTTGYVAEQWGRRWIIADTSRVALALSRTRLMGARFPYYALADNGVATGVPDVGRGFRYRDVQRVTLRSIANDSGIDAEHSLTDIERLIADHADREALVDQPVVDAKVVRVAGPFTVESLSPHLGMVPGEDGGSTEGDDVTRFQSIVIDHLRAAGVQNTVRKERLVFDSIEAWPGTRVQAVGEYQENSQTKRAAISIGPEYGTVNGDLVREAAKEAIKHCDLLVVCGFAFDGYVAEESKQLGNLTILRATMNPDLSLGEDLLKKTGAANLFIVFGEPDITIDRGTETWSIEIRGLDVYDPTTGEVRSHSVDDIACWFVDTDYNGESFFVRHAYFLGRDDPYDSLKRALRAEVSEEAWSSVNRSVSRPFQPPSTGKIAVKVINHYGDEVLKVYGTGDG